ncbi:immunoglobulin-like domain-containing protein [Paenibacillus spongiae]|uniref:S-layer homology domain-containing protein n=1 Tax=Paenibacillus spongiae TaxID=2909671 RepID=A0ABY5SGG6_9BACL|nr:immunoglobulin-like domain-containing protein [Paenibacillus spongiae]UVI33097.1 S-layer homology domain-containing protein [Paenibacillus spongiae]
MNRSSKAFNVRLLIISMLLTLIPSGLVQADAGGAAINLALGKEVTSSSSYEMSNEGWARVNLVDGSKTGPRPPGSAENGFSTHPFAGAPTDGSPAWVMIDLGNVYKVDQLVLWPRNDNGEIAKGGGFPVDFIIKISTDNANWTTVVEQMNYPVPADAAEQIFDIDTADARYVRLEATKLQEAKEVVMQFREFEVISSSHGLSEEDIVEQDAQSLEEELSGKTDNIAASLSLRKVGKLGSTISWVSSEPEVIDASGKVKRPPAGQDMASVTLTATIKRGTAELIKEFTVTVKPHKPREETEEELLIGIFWPPTWEYTNLEQYQWIKDAHVDVVQNVLGSGLDTEERNMTMLDYAEQVGLKVNVADPRIRGNEDQIKEVVETYKDYWATGGYYIRDEPGIFEIANEARIYKEVLKHDASKNPYVNLFPNIYGDLYESDYVRAWVNAVGKDGAGEPNLKYLSYDNYPFLKDTFDNNYYDMADIIRRVGLENGIKTASYLQSIGFGSSPENMHHRRPSAQDLSFSAYSYLAYGFKYLTWFTYWTPTNRGEEFTNAIIDPSGRKTDLYEPFQRLNGEVKQLGKTLIHLDALHVYHSGTEMPTVKPKRVPDDFLLRPADVNDELIISYMVHKDTGKSYVMAVNKSLTDSRAVTLQADPRVTDVMEISKLTGEPASAGFDPAAGSLMTELLPGEGRLYALEGTFPGYGGPQKPELLPEPAKSRHPLSNLALGQTVDASSDVGNWGWSKANAVDGKRIGSDESMGWSSAPIKPHPNPDTPAWIQVDLGQAYPVKTVTLWPRNDNGKNIGVGFPKALSVKVSMDGKEWNTVLSRSEIALPSDGKPAELILETAVPARYVRVETNQMRPDPNNAFAFQLAELEVYQDATEKRLDVQVESTDLIAGQTTNLKVGIWRDDDMALHPVQEATFTSSDVEVAKIDANGSLTALAEGEVTIIVEAEGKDGRTERKEIAFIVRKLPDPWSLTAFGDVHATVIPDSEALLLFSSGSGIGEQEDSYAFLHQAMDSTYNELSAAFNSFAVPAGAGGLEGRTGLMFRNGTEEGTLLAYLSISPEGRMELSTRNGQGAVETVVEGSYTSLPVSLKLVQQGDRFTGYYSKGSGWYPIHLNEAASTVQLSGQSEWQAGLASFSKVAGRQNRAAVQQLQWNPLNQEAADAAAAAITLGALSSVVSDIQLPTSGLHGTTISWKSSNRAFMSDSGKLLKRPAAGQQDQSITLTATVTKGDKSTERAFTVTIKAESWSGGPIYSYPTPPTNPVKPAEPEQPDDNSGGEGTTPTENGGNEPNVHLTDIAGHWAQASIERAVQLGIVTGYADGTFKGNRPVTRDEFITMLMRTMKPPTQGGSSSIRFTDADSIQEWAREAIARALKAGIITGYADGTFRPRQEITRTELTVITVRALELLLEKTNDLPFEDADQVQSWALQYINAAYKAGLITGRPGNLFAPQGQTTRAEAVALLIRMLEQEE